MRMAVGLWERSRPVRPWHHAAIQFSAADVLELYVVWLMWKVILENVIEFEQDAGALEGECLRW